MAVPKKRISSTRRDKRRSHHRLVLPNLSKCDKCNAPKLSHHLCSKCGCYKGKQILPMKKVKSAARE